MNTELQNIEVVLKLLDRVDLKGAEVARFAAARDWLIAQARRIQAESHPVAVPDKQETA